MFGCSLFTRRVNLDFLFSLCLSCAFVFASLKRNIESNEYQQSLEDFSAQWIDLLNTFENYRHFESVDVKVNSDKKPKLDLLERTTSTKSLQEKVQELAAQTNEKEEEPETTTQKEEIKSPSREVSESKIFQSGTQKKPNTPSTSNPDILVSSRSSLANSTSSQKLSSKIFSNISLTELNPEGNPQIIPSNPNLHEVETALNHILSELGNSEEHINKITLVASEGIFTTADRTELALEKGDQS